MPEHIAPVLVTGAAGQVGGVAGRVVELLRSSGIPVRALVRRQDERATRLQELGAEIVVADLTKSEEIFPAVQGCKCIFFSMSVSSQYLEASTVMAAAARASSGIRLLVNMSQMTLSEMDLTHVTESPQHRLQWLSEQVLNWSGVPVAHLRPTVFQENPLFWVFAARSIEKSGAIRLPFGESRTSPVAAQDVAEVAVKVLLDPLPYVGRILEITGPRSVDLNSIAEEYSAALGRSVNYVNISFETWEEETLKKADIPEHVYRHIRTMASLHAAGCYDRHTDTVGQILGRPATSLAATIKNGGSHFSFVPNGQ
ncbi:uncharacterized protein N7469_000667 [Penicillium citrinum]|uniref:NmrA-like domain-containing protein n=1 Tax=Penicillium citrinum TaxID=5077 RepID=A0A9W9PDD2_PENCI|nr:uncharacterized protein N7469_000667 [Penicillium citrinum]KAJ5242340.1 hypothetical protein N7469_000667 [Penicillium citrinum]KAK5806994.1 hypothetical protein VI817_001252 [Penicillium citrinum]